ncbi:MAG: DUF1553 domain-containing protein, partial [Planctomycetota bacterium]
PQSTFGAFRAIQNRRSSSLMIMPVDARTSFDRTFSRDEIEAIEAELIASESASFRGFGDQQAGMQARFTYSKILEQYSIWLARVDKGGQPRSFCMGVQELPKMEETRLLVRGEVSQPGQVVERAIPKVLCSSPVELPANTSGRLELAEWIGSDTNTLAARVMVNRIWMHLFGNGIVTSTEDFSVTGAMPSHPELLDYLAVRFVESRWSMKSLIRDITNSRVYRISSKYDENAHELDPANTLLWRANPRRLDAEAIRDAMLAASGEIDLERYAGSAIARIGYTRITQSGIQLLNLEVEEPDSENFGGGVSVVRGRVGLPKDRPRPEQQLDQEDATYRSVYLPIVRQFEPRSLQVFDFSDPAVVSGKRESSSTANQALYMMNNPFVIKRSVALAERLTGEAETPEEQVLLAFQLTYGRPPTDTENSAVLDFLKTYDAPPESTPLRAMCQSLFASAEFRYAD